MHEALRLFQDRLVHEFEREWLAESLDATALSHFPSLSQVDLERPLLFSSWLTKHYEPVDREALRGFVQARLRVRESGGILLIDCKVFNEEELDTRLVLFDDVLEHVLRIDRVFQQPQGHCLLIGISGGGKTTLSRSSTISNFQ